MEPIERIIIDENKFKAVIMKADNGIVNHPIKTLEFFNLTKDEKTIVDAAIAIIKGKAQ